MARAIVAPVGADVQLDELDRALIRNLSRNVTVLNDLVRNLQVDKDALMFKMQEMKAEIARLEMEQTKGHSVAMQLASALAIENLLCMRERYRR